MHWISIFIFGLSAITASATPYTIKASIPLPKHCFTQGLTLHKQQFFVSCGRYGHSMVYRLNLSGHILAKQTLPETVFAEGLSFYNNQLFLLTWKSEASYQLNPETLAVIKTIANKGEGWGLTSSNNALLQSDGSSFLYTMGIAPNTLQKQQRHLILSPLGLPITQLNELDILPRFIASNVWKKDDIIFIKRPLQAIQKISFKLSLNKLAQKHKKHGVLNGIAYDAKHQCLWVSGKMWPKAYALSVNLPDLQLPCTKPITPQL